MDKYAALGTFLRRQDRNVVTLSFPEIERIIRAPLPQSARLRREWWANEAKHHTQGRAWLGAGYEVVSVQLGKQGFVTFRKPGSGFWERLIFGKRT